jgi:hypothetical protein
MGIVDRVKNILISPKTEWEVVAAENTGTGALLMGYVLPLAAIAAIASLIGSSIIGASTFFAGVVRVPIVWGAALAIYSVVMAIVGVFILSLIINALAPSFGGEKNSQQALKVAVYSYTPAWVAGVFNIIPMLGILALLGALYGLFLLYLGLPKLMKAPEDKAVGYTVVVVICALVLSVIIGIISGVIGAAGLAGSGALSGMMGSSSPRSEVTFDKNSPLGKLEEMGKKMEEAGKKMEAAEKAGDQKAQMAAAQDAIGTLLGGGKRAEPVEIDQLKPFVPETFAGLPKKSSKAEKANMGFVVMSRAEARYSDDTNTKSVTLEISDAGGMGGLMGLAGWIGVTGEREDEYGREKTSKVDGRMVLEKQSKQPGGTNEFGIVLGERFIVTARGNGVDSSQLKAVVMAMDLTKLEGMKNVGVQK